MEIITKIKLAPSTDEIIIENGVMKTTFHDMWIRYAFDPEILTEDLHADLKKCLQMCIASAKYPDQLRYMMDHNVTLADGSPAGILTAGRIEK